MTGLALLVALKVAALKIFEAVMTLLPGPLAYGLYRAVIRAQTPLAQTPPRERYWRIFCQLFWGVFVAAIIAYGFGASCPQDDDGYCSDPDWTRPDSAHLLASFVRLGILILGGMLFAYDRVKKERAGLA